MPLVWLSLTGRYSPPVPAIISACLAIANLAFAHCEVLLYEASTIPPYVLAGNDLAIPVLSSEGKLFRKLSITRRVAMPTVRVEEIEFLVNH